MKDEALAKFIQEQAPSRIKNAYYGLKEFAQKTDFSDLTHNIVILDTETTGLQFYAADLIEIAAIKIENGKIASTFQTFVKPTQPIPKAISELTNITNQDVQDAPSAKKAVAELAQFVQGLPVLAHNAAFDKGFITKVEGGKDVSSTWIDTLALSRIALPLLKNHKLQDMAAAFGCDIATHRAIDDVHALFDVWRIMLAALFQFDTALLARLASFHPETPWVYRHIFETVLKLKGEKNNHAFSLLQTRKMKGVAEATRAKTAQKDDTLKAREALSGVDSEEVEAFFSEKGALKQQFASFEPRKEQVEMAKKIAKVLSSEKNLAIEVGTGVGKSLAYLVPLSLFAKANNTCVGVCTKTNMLADQIIYHELPRISKALHGELTFAALKGFDHYPCFRKIEAAATNALPSFSTPYASVKETQQEMLTALATLYVYGTYVEEGDLDTLGIRWNMVPRSFVSSTSTECMRKKCPFYENGCMAQGARRKAAQVDVLITNHALLLCDIAADGNILPPIRQWVVDEAHGFSAEARRQWAQLASSDSCKKALDQLGDASKGALHNHMVAASKREDQEPALGLLSKANAFLGEARPLLHQFFAAIHECVLSYAPKTNYDQAELWISQTLRDTPLFAKLKVIGEESAEKLSRALGALMAYQDLMQDLKGAPSADLTQPIKLLSSTQEAIVACFGSQQENTVYSLSASQSRRKKRPLPEQALVQELNVGPILAEKLYTTTQSVVYCSATIAVGSSFEHFNEEVGFSLLDADEYETSQMSSPFSYDENMKAFVVQDAPEPNSAHYLEELSKMLIDIHLATKGSVLTLFTNRREMEACYKKVKPALEAHQLTLSQQGAKTSKRKLAQEFSENKAHSLFALKTFWEGFDARGETLRCVVIPKLPFASPTDPLVKEREQHDGWAFMRYSLPEAALLVKQAAGRLIRSSNDTGVVILCDSRICTKGYGKQFVAALPTRSIKAVPQSMLFDEVSATIAAFDEKKR